MTGSVRKYGPTWRIRWDAGIKPNGDRDQRSKGGFRTRKEAEVALSEALTEARQGRVVDTRKLTVASWLETWLTGKHNLRPSTRRAYESHIRVYLTPLIGHCLLSALRADHLDAMYEDIRAGRLRRPPSAATLHRLHATLHSALQTAYRRRVIPQNPAAQVELEGAPRNVRAIWTPQELSAFLRHASQDRLAAAYHLAAFTGLRRGELCGLRWRDLNLEQGLLTVYQQHVEVGSAVVVGEPKTKGSARVVALDLLSVSVLRGHKAAQAAERLAWGSAYQDKGLVFVRENGAPLRPEYVTRHFLRLGAEAGLPRIVLHALRHTHASHALAAGVSMALVSQRLGHSSIAITADTYTQILPQVARDAAELVAALCRQADAESAQSSSAVKVP